MTGTTGRDIIRRAATTADEMAWEKVFNRVNDLLLRVTDQSTEMDALIEAQAMLRQCRSLRHCSDARERGDMAREVLLSLIADAQVEE